MILFIFTKIIKRIFFSYKTYFMIVVEVMIGIAILNTILTINSSINLKYEEMKLDIHNRLVKLEIYNKALASKRIYGLKAGSLPGVYDINDNEDEKSDFGLEDYNWISSSYNEYLDIHFVIRRNFTYFLYENNKAYQIKLIAMSSAAFDYFFPQASVNNFENTNMVFTGKNIKTTLKKGNVYIKDGSIPNETQNIHFSIANSDNFYLGDICYQVHEVDMLKNNSITIDFNGIYEKIDLNNAVIVPIGHVADFLKEKGISLNDMSMAFNFKKDEFVPEIIVSIQKYLNKKHSFKYGYRFDSTLAEFQRQTMTMKIIVSALTVLSAVVLFIVIFGLTGIFLLIVNKRIKEIAISIALGSSKVIMVVEVISEMLVIILSGGITGIFASIAILKSQLFNFKIFMIALDYRVILISLLIPFLIVGLSGVLPAFRIRKMSPVRTLQDL